MHTPADDGLDDSAVADLQHFYPADVMLQLRDAIQAFLFQQHAAFQAFQVQLHVGGIACRRLATFSMSGNLAIWLIWLVNVWQCYIACCHCVEGIIFGAFKCC